MRDPRFVRFALVCAALALLLPASPGLGQSTCTCPAGTWLGVLGTRVSHSGVNPAWATCFCGHLFRGQASMEIRNAADLEGRLARNYSLPEEDYVMWAKARDLRLQRKEEVMVRAASIPGDPLMAATHVLATDGRTSAGSFRPRIDRGVLVLRGEVPTSGMKDLALDLAGEASGMRVHDQLRVTGLGAVLDERIQADVEAILVASGRTGTSVEVENGVVWASPALPREDEDLILQVPGVRAVQ